MLSNPFRRKKSDNDAAHDAGDAAADVYDNGNEQLKALFAPPS